MLVSESSAMHQLRRRSAQKPQLDLIADRMSPRTLRRRSLSLTDALMLRAKSTRSSFLENHVQSKFLGQ